MTVLASPIAAGSSYTTAVFGLVGVLVGGVIAGSVGLWTAKQTREAAERAWVRDNRRAIYDRFLTCAQTLLIACEDARKSQTEGGGGGGASVKSADMKFWSAYSVVLTVADGALSTAARIYAYRLWELSDSLRSDSVMGPENFDRVTLCIRDGRHDTIDAMRAELRLDKTIWPPPDYNPFVGTKLQEEYGEGLKKISKEDPEKAGAGAVVKPCSFPSFKGSSSYPIKVEVPGLLHQVYVGLQPTRHQHVRDCAGVTTVRDRSVSDPVVVNFGDQAERLGPVWLTAACAAPGSIS